MKPACMLWKKFETYLTVEKNYSPNSLAAYRTDIHDFRNYLLRREIDLFEEEGVVNIKHRDIRAWMGKLIERGLGYRSVARKVSALKSYFSFLYKSGTIAGNPATKVKVPGFEKKLPAFLKQQETQSLFEHIEFPHTFEGARDRCVLELLYGCGLRRSELIALKPSSVDLSNQYLRVLGKGNKERLIPFGKPVREALKHYQNFAQSDGISLYEVLLVRKDGMPMYPKLVYRIVQKYLTLVSSIEKISPHVLRHTYATHMLENGADLNAIKELLGHKSLAATQVYTHNTIGKLKKVHVQAHPRASTHKSDSL